MRLPKDLRELFASEGSKTTPTDAGPQWGQSFSYDGTDHYVYDPANRRVWKQEPTRELIYFYEVDGTLLTTYGDNGYFAGKLIWQGGAAPAAASSDRLGSLTKNYPYGEEYTTTGQDTFKFATYYRDQTTTLDYAQQRYYARTIGRFTSPDPSMDNVDYLNPGSWNAYAYVNGDPINLVDPDGLTACGDLSPDTGGTVRDQVNANTAQGHFIDLVWHEAGFLSQSNGNVGAWTAQFEFIAQAIWDRYQLVQGNFQVTGANGVVYGGGTVGWLGYGAYGSTLNTVLINAAANTDVLNSQGQLVS